MSLDLKSMPAAFRDFSFRKNRVLKICVICLAATIAMFAWAVHRRSELCTRNQAAFLARFLSSFDTGFVRLGEKPEIDEIKRLLMPEFSFGTLRPSEVNEYVVTAPFERNGTTLWGRWLYTCNGSHGDGIVKFGYAEAATREGLPRFPSPGQRYISWTDELVDGIPSTAGPTATILSRTSPIRASSPFTLVVRSDPGTVCRLQTFPPDASLTPSTDMEPDKKGELRWAISSNPKYAGGGVRVIVKCVQMRGARRLETSTECPNVTILP
jgi:hypothetical protein